MLQLLRQSARYSAAVGARFALEHVGVVHHDDAEEIDSLLVLTLQLQGQLRAPRPRSRDQKLKSRNTCPQLPGGGSTPLRRAAACIRVFAGDCSTRKKAGEVQHEGGVRMMLSRRIVNEIQS